MHFSEINYDEVVKWLEVHRWNLSALIHEDTGDDLKDQTDGARWLGPVRLKIRKNDREKELVEVAPQRCFTCNEFKAPVLRKK